MAFNSAAYDDSLDAFLASVPEELLRKPQAAPAPSPLEALRSELRAKQGEVANLRQSLAAAQSNIGQLSTNQGAGQEVVRLRKEVQQLKTRLEFSGQAAGAVSRKPSARALPPAPLVPHGASVATQTAAPPKQQQQPPKPRTQAAGTAMTPPSAAAARAAGALGAQVAAATSGHSPGGQKRKASAGGAAPSKSPRTGEPAVGARAGAGAGTGAGAGGAFPSASASALAARPHLLAQGDSLAPPAPEVFAKLFADTREAGVLSLLRLHHELLPAHSHSHSGGGGGGGLVLGAGAEGARRRSLLQLSDRLHSVTSTLLKDPCCELAKPTKPCCSPISDIFYCCR